MARALKPDGKDWTWVLERPCPDCGFAADNYPRDDLGADTRAAALAWAAQLHREDARIRTRPDRWSVLEYGCHVRDVFRIFDGRLALMLAEDGPVFDDWDQDATAVAERYDLQDPIVVADELATAAGALAERLDGVSGAEWERTGVRSNGSPFTVETLGRYMVHDPLHHLWDVSGSRA